jgi:hypothetical protein
VHEVEHLGVALVAGLLDAVVAQRLGSASAALVEGGDEALAVDDPVLHGVALAAHVSPPRRC